MTITARQRQVRALFARLMKRPLDQFPEEGRITDAPDTHGVYVIYGPRKHVLHVGASIRGKGGLRQRLNNHLDGNSSFVAKYLHHERGRLRRGCFFQYIKVNRPRTRAYLEHYAIGFLCPSHIGKGQPKA